MKDKMTKLCVYQHVYGILLGGVKGEVACHKILDASAKGLV